MSSAQQARLVSDIRFPEFTAGLINSTFDAIISSNIRQMGAYVDLMRMVSQSLSEYLNNTRDDISGDEVLAFLEKVLPAYEDDTANTTHVHSGSVLTAPQATVLNNAVKLPSDAGVTAPTIPAGAIDASEMSQIIEAVTNRLACNKYNLLKEMVKQGVLRLVIENGTIETRLTFSAYDYQSYSRNSSSYSRSASSTRKVGTSGVFQTLFSGASLSASSNTQLHVQTANQSSRATEGSNTTIFGGVKLQFKTDYLPLATE